MRPKRKRNAPKAHQALWIASDCFLEITQSLIVVEGVKQPQPLIEIPLNTGNVRADWVVMVAEIVEEGRGLYRRGTQCSGEEHVPQDHQFTA